MGLVSEVLSNGGTLPQLEEVLKKKKILTRKNGLKFSLLWFLFFVFIATPFWGIVDVEELAGMSAILGVFGSLILFICSFVLLGKQPEVISDQNYIQNQQRVPNNITGRPINQSALPPQQTQPAQDFVAPAAGHWKSYDTGDLVQPGSVTEGTTKLLQKDEEEQQTKNFK
jgi:hypothetical protein